MQKLSIQQTAEKIGVATSTLRYYEEAGILPGIQRNDSGHRIYEDQDLGWISWIVLLRSSGMPIETIRRFVELSQSGNDSIPARCEILDDHRQIIRERIEELQSFLAKLDDKLQYYHGLLEEA